jgi:hypothetical protein
MRVKIELERIDLITIAHALKDSADLADTDKGR